MSAETIVLVVAVVVALAFSASRLARDGQFRARRAGRVVAAASNHSAEVTGGGASLLLDTPWAGELGQRATLLQFSSSFCAPCRATRRTLAEVARIVPGVAHVEVDAESHLDLVRRLGILRTPTTLVLDEGGREVRRAQGAPTKQSVIAGLGELA